ncbi:hypothetical protein OPKNFCMD_5116 [Methylobacterium crusticola]|uniref:Uncharacterized protein n=1 Tax=Methylobacterium crusticola TaxID=1697972 RepID=A0ABQ4R3T8_9HYPH|nr:hypothetical protein [Methylobacterium crusticola]GJD52351.1 hypothetical protein OPKNFCMD_5116 [Methylobacterium crusticola]
MPEIGRMRKSGTGRSVGQGLGDTSRGYLPLIPTACVAACLAAGSFYWRDAPPRAPAGQVAAVQPLPPGADLFRTAPDGLDHRVRAPYPVEFEQQFPLIAGLAAPAAEATPVLPAPDARGGPRRASAHRARAVPALAGVRPPARPEALRLAAAPRPDPVPEAAAQRTASAAPAEASGRGRLPGLPWLPFAPTGRVVVQSMVALGDSVVDAGAAMIDLIDGRR